MNALKDETLRLVAKGHDPLAAQDIGPVALHQLVQPGHKQRRIDIAGMPDGKRLHFGIVNGLETPVVVVRVKSVAFVIAIRTACVILMPVIMVRVVVIVVRRVMMIVVMMFMIVVVVIMRFGVEEMRLNIEDSGEIEGVTLQNRGQRHVGAHSPMHDGIGIDATDPRLDFGQLPAVDEIGFVENDNVREGDLRLRFRRIL